MHYIYVRIARPDGFYLWPLLFAIFILLSFFYFYIFFSMSFTVSQPIHRLLLLLLLYVRTDAGDMFVMLFLVFCSVLYWLYMRFDTMGLKYYHSYCTQHVFLFNGIRIFGRLTKPYICVDVHTTHIEHTTYYSNKRIHVKL